MKSLTLAIASVFALAGAAFGSPSAHTWHREILLGANSKEHTYLLWKMDNAGISYGGIESLFVYQRSNVDARWQERLLIRATVRTGDNAGNGTKVESFIGTTDVQQYLADHDCHPAFFASLPESIGIDQRGVYAKGHGGRSYFLTRAELAPWLGSDFQKLDSEFHDARVVGMFETTAVPDSEQERVGFLMVRSGRAMDDAGQFEGIVPVAASKVQEAVRAARTRLAPPPRPKAVKR